MNTEGWGWRVWKVRRGGQDRGEDRRRGMAEVMGSGEEWLKGHCDRPGSK